MIKFTKMDSAVYNKIEELADEYVNFHSNEDKRVKNLIRTAFINGAQHHDIQTNKCINANKDLPCFHKELCFEKYGIISKKLITRTVLVRMIDHFTDKAKYNMAYMVKDGSNWNWHLLVSPSHDNYTITHWMLIPHLD